MEEVAICAWHGGDVRSTTHGKVVAQCERSRLSQLLQDVIGIDAKGDVTLLFMAFYFRQAKDRRDDNEAYEFTHKSFGECLLACRCFRLVNQILDDLNTPSGRFGDTEALEWWIEVFGPAPIDRDAYDFLCDVAQRCPVPLADSWQRLIARLIGAVLRQGMPMTKTGIGTYQEMTRQSINAERALIFMHSACAAVTGKSCPINWPIDKPPFSVAAGQWIGRIGYYGATCFAAAKTIDTPDSIVFLSLKDNTFDVRMCFNHLHLDNVAFSGLPMVSARLVGASLKGADLRGSRLDHANLIGANLENSFLASAVLAKANLSHATLDGAD